MLLPNKPICSANKGRKDGTSLFFLQYCKSEKDKTLRNTEIAIPSRYWNKKLRRVADTLPPEYLDHDKLNLELNRMQRVAEDIIIHAIIKKYPDLVSFVKETFTPDYDTSKLETAKPKVVVKEKVNLDFSFQMEQYIKSKEGTVAIGTMHVFKNLKLILETFEAHRKKPITFE